MNLFKKFLLVLCIAISAQPAYGWGWNGINLSSITSAASSYISSTWQNVSENKAAVGIGLAVVGALAFSKYAYGKYSENNKESLEKLNQIQKNLQQTNSYCLVIKLIYMVTQLF